jgi:type I site-specific restriction endonuclease
MQKSIKSILLCLLLIILGGTSAFSQTNENQKISSVMDDKISQLNTALTRIIDRQENLRTSVTKLDEKLTLFSERMDAQEAEISRSLMAEIEALKSKTSTEMASIQEALTAISDLTTAIDDLRSVDETNEAGLNDALKLIKNSQESLAAISELTAAIDDLRSVDEANNTELKNDLKIAENNIDVLMQERKKMIWINAFTVMEDETGFAKLVSREEITRVAVTIPNKERCSEIGEWLVENVPMRDANRFYVMNDEEYAVCKNINGSWATLPVSGAEKSHVVYEQS